jgi:hypothetical protein
MTADEIDEKTGDLVAEVLNFRHPEAKIPDVRHLPTNAERPVLTYIDVTPDVVERLARHLSGSAGLGGSDAHALTHIHWLRSALADLGSWMARMANKSPPWAG